MEKPFKDKNIFFERIDSIRGLAALAVAIGHVLIASEQTRGLNIVTVSEIGNLTFFKIIIRLLLVVFNGEAAVMCFFVISGFVLYKSLNNLHSNNKHWIAEFYKRRILRIYPALIVSYIIFGLYLETPTNQFVQGILLWGIGENPVTWTLKVELLMAILLPFIYLMLNNKKFVVLPIIISIVVFITYNYNVNTLLPHIQITNMLLGQVNYFVRISVYILPFVLGMYGYKYYDILKKYCSKTPIFLLGLIVLLSTGFLIIEDSYYSVLIESFAGFIVVIGCSDSKHTKILSLKPFVWLGKISYSFYLYHTLACYFYTITVFKLLNIPYPLPNIGLNLFLCSVITVGLSILLGWISYEYVERPFITRKK